MITLLVFLALPWFALAFHQLALATARARARGLTRQSEVDLLDERANLQLWEADPDFAREVGFDLRTAFNPPRAK